ncbi:cytochrome C biogenesis protein ResB [Comamonas serinivorans]|uniref:Cytochrome C biogenesis protein ResB n=1 Tax=Comamonas serinivorans TaxID=1082851 RepID=A0A1Y0ERZ6_9BURK|nr:cytochrome c biogenesis protein ResB [Comamonas serinivorans]ARU06268.1 cytochrome C biogenesis protein ResB [Comamonas serinivorans]
MAISTDGMQMRQGSPTVRSAVELLSSMRFAIALLTLICIASVIGTVLQQHQPLGNYINEFGPFWTAFFVRLQLQAIYSAWWFLLIMAFLVVSTSLCIARNAPKILADLKTFKEDIRAQSLRAFHHKAEAALPEAPQLEATRLGNRLIRAGWKVKLQARETPQGEGIMLAAKAGSANKLGYLAAHGAIVLICLGGLLDGDWMVRAQMWLGGKTAYRGSGQLSQVPDVHRLSTANPTFRGNLLVPEGQQSGTALLSLSNGVLLQDLPFTVELKKFIVEYYSTGMPKLFASEIVIHDKDTGAATPARVEVNHPVTHRGVTLYQSSFDDGGSQVKLVAHALSGAAVAPAGLEVAGTVGGSQAVQVGDQRMTLEFDALRVINVENMGGGSDTSVDVRKVDLANLGEALKARLGSGTKGITPSALHNVGPSITYRLRDAAGQAREFNNYMLPVDMKDGGVPVFLLGVRENLAEPFRYLRIPADEHSTMAGFERLRLALADPALRQQAVARYARQAVADGREAVQAQLAESAGRVLDVFAGAVPIEGADGGLQAVAGFLERNVPEAERERAGSVLVRILNGTLVELDALARERAGLPTASQTSSERFLSQAIVALSDARLYPVPLTFQLRDFQHIQASVFQVAKTPGKWVVYLGCALLILGVFAMLYVRERRLWIWLTPGSGAKGRSHATMALSSNRKTLDADQEFARLRHTLLGDQEEPR